MIYMAAKWNIDINNRCYLLSWEDSLLTTGEDLCSHPAAQGYFPLSRVFVFQKLSTKDPCPGILEFVQLLMKETSSVVDMTFSNQITAESGE